MNEVLSLETSTQNTIMQEFCLEFSSQYNQRDFFKSELLADEFRQYFDLKPILTLEKLTKFAKKKLGIREVKPFAFQNKTRGLNVRLGNNIKILYKESDWIGSQEFTVAHEIREILGQEMKMINPIFEDYSGDALEYQAEAFAAALLMDRVKFFNDMEITGLDPIELHKMYNLSYIAVASRMASVLNGENNKWHLWSSVLESNIDLPKGFLKAGSFHRSPKYIPKVRFRIPNTLFPKRGQLVPIRDIISIVCENKKPVYIDKLTGLDFWNKYCLSVIIRPVIWNEKIAKLIIIAVPDNQSYRFHKQIMSSNPIMIDESYQVI